MLYYIIIMINYVYYYVVKCVKSLNPNCYVICVGCFDPNVFLIFIEHFIISYIYIISKPVQFKTMFDRFMKQRPNCFKEAKTPMDPEAWIDHIEKIFRVLECSEVEKA